MGKLINNLKQIFSQTLQGGVIISGNTCTVIGDLNNKVKEFIKLDGSYTANWKEMGSTSYLEIPKNSRVIFAVLEWHSTISNYITKSDLKGAYKPIVFITPKKRTTISISPEDDNEAIYDDGNFNKQSVKWKDVTSLIKRGGEGYYSVEGIPTSPIVNDLNSLPNHDEAPGWSLTVVYENSSLPFRNISVFMGIQNHDYTVEKINRTLTIPNLKVPSIPKKTYLSLVASNGNPNMYAKLNLYSNISFIYNNDFKHLVGNYMDASLHYINDSILPYDNIFSGIIMNTNTESSNYGLIETRGTLGNLNNTAFDILNQKSFKGNRGKLDILSFDISSKMNPYQEKLILTVNLDSSPASPINIITYAFQTDLE